MENNCNEEEFVNGELTCSVKHPNGVYYLELLKKYNEEKIKKEKEEKENKK